jgi:hypothetical protein
MKGEVSILAGSTSAQLGALSGYVVQGSTIGLLWQAVIEELPDADLASLVGKWIRVTNLSGDVQEVQISSVSEFSVDSDKIEASDFIMSIYLGDGGFWQEITPSFPERLDLYEAEIISQNWQFSDISTFQARGSFTREFRIPYTDVNQKIFGMIPLSNFEDQGKIFDEKIPARILVDNLPVISGYLRVIRVIRQRDREYDLEISFYGDAPDLFTSLQGKKLADLSDLPNKAHELNLSYVNSQPDPDILYSLCDRGTGNSLTLAEVMSTEVADVTKYTPAMRWGYLFRQILNDAGFEYDADDLLSVLDSIWMPWLNATPWAIDTRVLGFRAVIEEEGDYPLGGQYYNEDSLQDFTGQYPLWAALGKPPPTPHPWIESFDNNENYKPQGITPNIDLGYYECPYYGYYTWRLWFTWDHLNLSGQAPFIVLGVKVFLPSGADYEINDGVGNFQTLDPAAGSGVRYVNCTITTPDLQPLPAGTKVIFQAKAIHYAPATLGNYKVHVYPGNSTNYQGTGWELVNITNVNFGAGIPSIDVSMVSNAPDALQVDFLRDCISMFNLAVIPDKLIPKKIAFKFMTSYLGSEATEDWSQKLAIDKDIILKSTSDFVKSKLAFSYSAGDDSASKLFVDIGKRIYGNYEVSGYTALASEDPFDFAQGESKVQLTTKSSPCSNFPGTDRTMLRLIKEDGGYTPPGMRALYHAETFTRTDGSSYRVLNHYSQVVPEFNDFDLNFAPEIPLHNFYVNPFNNLFNLYWRGYLNEIYSKRGRVMEAFFALDLTDIIEFSFGKYYWIKDSYWRVLSISDYKYGTDDLTKVTLIKVLNVEADCNLTPIGASPLGLIEWVDLQGNPAEGSPICCKRNGYTWSADREECYTRGGGSTGGIAQIDRDSIIKVLNDQDIKLRPEMAQTKIDQNTLLSSIAADAFRSTISGTQITLKQGNSDSIAVGRSLTIEENNGSVAAFGRDAIITNNGLHFGGATRLNSGALGSMQYGEVLLGNSMTFNAAGDDVILTQGGSVLKHVQIPVDTAWSFILQLVGYSGGDFAYSIYSGLIYNKAGTLDASSMILISQEDSFGNHLSLEPEWVLTSPPDFKLYAKLMNPGAPQSFPITLNIDARISYTQVR